MGPSCSTTGRCSPQSRARFLGTGGRGEPPANGNTLFPGSCAGNSHTSKAHSREVGVSRALWQPQSVPFSTRRRPSWRHRAGVGVRAYGSTQWHFKFLLRRAPSCVPLAQVSKRPCPVVLGRSTGPLCGFQGHCGDVLFAYGKGMQKNDTSTSPSSHTHTPELQLTPSKAWVPGFRGPGASPHCQPLVAGSQSRLGTWPGRFSAHAFQEVAGGTRGTCCPTDRHTVSQRCGRGPKTSLRG